MKIFLTLIVLAGALFGVTVEHVIEGNVDPLKMMKTQESTLQNREKLEILVTEKKEDSRPTSKVKNDNVSLFKQMDSTPLKRTDVFSLERVMPFSDNTGKSSSVLPLLGIKGGCLIPGNKKKGRTLNVYWTEGDQTWPLIGDKTKFQVDINVVVKTADYTPGDCIPIVLASRDEEDNSMEESEITIHGFVDPDGWVFIRRPFETISFE